jgi:hypothetical protein
LLLQGVLLAFVLPPKIDFSWSLERTSVASNLATFKRIFFMFYKVKINKKNTQPLHGDSLAVRIAD